MTSQAASIAERLFEAESPYDLENWENKDGYYIATCRVSKEDVPGLIDIASKWSDSVWSGDELGLDADLENVGLLPVTAWRTLADLKASEAVEPLVYMLTNLDDEFDEWARGELPHVFGKIGKPAMAAMVQLADDADRPYFLRTIAAAALHRIAEYHTETRDDVAAALAQMMTKADRSNIEFNSILLVGLVELRAVEAAETIERAFAGDFLDVGMMGDWEDVRRRLGVEGLGLQMPERPQNSIEQFRRRMGIGVFSDRPIYDEGEIDPDAEQAYYARAWDGFAPSQEAKRFVDRFGDPGWFQMLLEFGLNYRGEIIDEITLGGVDEFLFDYVPRKVSTKPERAMEIVLELTLFWEYLQRVYDLPNAKSIIEWLKTDGLVARLQAEMSDPSNFGIAKSIVMSGKAAGYDMTSEKGAAEFMAAYNRSLQQDVESAPAPVVSGREKIGRNDPCPCGSGKKFKKCCR